MKNVKIAALFLALLMLLASCGGGLKTDGTQTAASAETAQTGEETLTGEVRTVYAPLTEMPRYTLTAATSPDEIRAMAVKAMRDELSVQWYVEKDFSYDNHNGQEFKISSREVYAGLPYTQSGSGLLQWLQYYEFGTGRMTGVGADIQGNLGNSCAASVMWGWSSVVSSISWNTTYTMTPAHGCLPVGGYKVDMNLADYRDYTTTRIVEDNGEEAIMRAYAAVLPADGLVSFMNESSAHAQMAIEPAHVEYKDGKIDPENSYIMIQDQHKGHMVNTWSIVTEDDQRLHYAGHTAQKMTFSKLLNSCYIPVTTAEFIGTKPYTEPGITVAGAENVKAIQDVTGLTISSPYKIITIRLVIKDGDEELVESKKILGRSEIEKGTALNYNMSRFSMPAGMSRKLEKGKTYTAALEVLIATGDSYTPVEFSYTYNG